MQVIKITLCSIQGQRRDSRKNDEIFTKIAETQVTNGYELFFAFQATQLLRKQSVVFFFFFLRGRALIWDLESNIIFPEYSTLFS